ncbi:MAG TPA: glycoside hydrolase family 27 protein [Bryobacteraceae bacterium]|nr:glycoside hydrolase family 27 protein [Bryobacteraceae bacterium]
MKTLFALACIVLAPSLGAADLTGHWTSLSSGAPNPPISLWLKADGSRLTGYMSFRGNDSPISAGKIEGDRLLFDIVRDYFGEARRTSYSGVLAGGELRITLPSMGGRPPREMTFKRVSEADPPPLPPAPSKVTLPPAKDVPYNGLAKTPPMGWNSWNKFRNQVSDQLVRQVADAIASNGMKAAGYIYVNIDDTWEAGRDTQGAIQTNARFPDMKALADYIHGKGLKFGIYSSPGPKTCAGYEGSYQHEAQDARTYAAWGVDYLKYDWCSASQVYDYHSMPAIYAKMGLALENSGRPIVFSLCQYGVLKVEQWGASVGGNLWRTTGDIRDSWQSMSDIGFDHQIGLESAAGPGHWNDPDMLEIGNGGMTNTEYRAHMSLWAMLAAPLLAGNDLRSVPPDILEILTNKEVIAVDQDPLGKQGKRVAKNGGAEVWARPLAGGAWAVGLFNRGDASARMKFHATDIGLTHITKVRDLWEHADHKAGDSYSAEVASHGVVMLKVEGL